jgi:uncharacterized protein YqeY
MANSLLRARIIEDMKSAMRAKDRARLSTVRLMLASIKQQEVDLRIELDDAAIIAILDKMTKQRKDSITQYEAADRNDLAAIEQQELDLLLTYLPEQMSDADMDALLLEAITATAATSMRDMGKVMAFIKPKAQGRADMGKLSGLVKAKLLS